MTSPLFNDDKETLTKQALVEEINEVIGLSKHEAKDMVESFFEYISAELEQGREVLISGFGKFRLLDKAGRPGRNPKTGEPIPVTARRVVVFTPSIQLREQVNSGVPKKKANS